MSRLVSFFADAACLRAGLWSSGAAAWSVRKAALPSLAQGCNVVLSLRTLELVARDAVAKGAAKNRNKSVRKHQRVLAQGAYGGPRGKVSYGTLYLVVGS